MALNDLIHRLTAKFSSTDDDPSTSKTVRAIDEGDPTRTIVSDEEPPPIEGK